MVLAPLLAVEAQVVNVASPDERRRLIRLAGPALEPILRNHQPAHAVRVEVPGPGSKPLFRVYTLHDIDLDVMAVTLDVVATTGGPGARWATEAQPGDRVVVHGSRYGYVVDAEAPLYLLIGDDTAQPAIAEICRALPAGTRAHIFSVGVGPGALDRLASAATLSRTICADVDDVISRLQGWGSLPAGARVWCAGEARLVHTTRRYVRHDLGLPRAEARFAVYWRQGLALNETAPIEEAERQRVRDHGITLVDVHDHDDFEPLVDFKNRT